MAIFPVCEYEPIVQVDDKTRIDATKSFVTDDQQSISLVKIKPASAESFITVTTNKYLDWQYSASGNHTITVHVEAGAASASALITRTISVLTEASDKLFSTDQDLKLHEPDILKWVQDGRTSFKDVHRRAQTLILKWLDKEGYVDSNNDPFTKAAIVDIEEVKQWSTFLVLKLIFEGLSNATDDIFHEKAKRYSGKMAEFRKKSLLRIDVDGDGVVDEGEGIGPAYGFVTRR